MKLNGKRILLGISGGVAAFKSATLARELQRRGATVQVVMTEAATRFVGVATFQALTGQPVFVDLWDERIASGMAHIDLARQADAIVVAPASADFIARLAAGLGSDLLASLCIARDVPLLIAPAMNRQMWEHPATRRNVATLVGDGVIMLGPASGEQACGETGDGRMLEADEIVEELEAFFTLKRLDGRRALVSAGPTFEPIDPVRGITNLSSGRMGFAIARACRHAGATVVLVAGPVSLPCPAGVRRVDVTTALQMRDAIAGELDASHFDLFISVAAVADWRVVQPSPGKIKKVDGAGPPPLEFVENPDILAEVVRRADAPWCVGFAAESDDLERNGAAKRKRKGVELLVANIGHETFGRDDNELLLIDEHGARRLPRASKDSLAADLVAEIAARLPARARDEPAR